MKKGIITLIWAAFALGACHDKGEVYDPNYNPELGVSVPDGFDWSTTQELTVNVEVNDEYDGKYYYAVRIYDKKPGEGVLPVVASGEVTGDMPFSQKIVVPAGISKLYIAQVFKNADASEVVTVKEVAIDSDIITCVFGSNRSARGISSRDDDKKTLEGTMTFGEEYKGKKYEVSKDKTLTITSVSKDAEDIEINVYGTLIFSSNVSLHDWDIDVENGGELKAEDLTLTSESELENHGTVTVKNLLVEDNSTLENDDNEKDHIYYPGGCLIAENDIIFNTKKGIELEERSFMSCSNMYLKRKAEFKMETGAWLRIRDILSAESGESTFKFEGSTIKGFKYGALIQAGSIIGVDEGISVKQKILVACPDVAVSHNIASLVNNAEGLIKIVGSTCSGNFGDTEPFQPLAYTYIMEDQYPNEGDYDMNDIVVEIVANQKGKQLTLTGKLVALGAKYRITPWVKVGDSDYPLFKHEDDSPMEAYEALTGSTSDPEPIGTMDKRYSKDFAPIVIELQDDMTVKDLDFYIIVNGKEIHSNTHQGSATWGMVIPKPDFKYPKEGVRITEAYKNFNEWFTDKKSRWYDYPKMDKVVP